MKNYDVAVGKDKNGDAYLVDRDGRLVYYFLPSLLFQFPLAERWPDPTQTWAKLWRPVTCETARGPVVHDPDGTLSKTSFDERLQDRETRVYHVWMGVHVPSFDDKGMFPKHDNPVKVGLYTYAYDLPLSSYDVRIHHEPWEGQPAGFVYALWHPAQVKSGALPVAHGSEVVIDGPVGSGMTAGP